MWDKATVLKNHKAAVKNNLGQLKRVFHASSPFKYSKYDLIVKRVKKGAAKKKLMMIFISDQGAWTLGHSTDLYCDGTFESCPDPFAQIYFIMGQMGPGKKAVPCMFALLPDKDGQTYMKLWNFLKSLGTFEDRLPITVTSDFEKGVLSTLGSVFPHPGIKGCNFHQKQAIRRNIQSKGLLTLLNHSTKFSYLVKMMYGLAFVLPHRITDIFDGIIMDYVDSHKDCEGFIEYAEEVEAFIAYFQRTWTGLIAGRNRTRRHPMFDISTWNQYEDVLADRKITNNNCEGMVYHLSLLIH
jgi:hypothetical protein